MKWIVSLILSLAACGLVFLGAVDDQPLVAPPPLAHRAHRVAEPTFRHVSPLCRSRRSSGLVQ
jgi:hypothetical protein